MKKLQDYTSEAVTFAAPYVKSAGEHVDAAAHAVKKQYRKKKRKLERVYKWNKRRKIIESCAAVALLAAAVLAIIMMIADRLRLGKRNYIQL